MFLFRATFSGDFLFFREQRAYLTSNIEIHVLVSIVLEILYRDDSYVFLYSISRIQPLLIAQSMTAFLDHRAKIYKW